MSFSTNFENEDTKSFIERVNKYRYPNGIKQNKIDNKKDFKVNTIIKENTKNNNSNLTNSFITKDKTTTSPLKKVNLHKNHRKRLRHFIRNSNIETYDEIKILEYLLTNCHTQKDVNPLAHELLNSFGGFSGVLEAQYSELIKVKGVSEVTATFLSSFLSIYSFYLNNKPAGKVKLSTPIEYVKYYGNNLRNEPTEKLALIFLNKKLESKGQRQISIGTETEVKFQIQEIFNILSINQCDNLVLMHNHPSGNSNPSCEDLLNTQEIFWKLKMFNINLIDHIIVSKDNFFSFKAHDIIDTYEKLLSSGFDFKTKITFKDNDDTLGTINYISYTDTLKEILNKLEKK